LLILILFGFAQAGTLSSAAVESQADEGSPRSGKISFDPDTLMASRYDMSINQRHLLSEPQPIDSKCSSNDRPEEISGIPGVDFVNIGPVNGAGRASVISPHPTIDGLLLLGSAGGGVWKTSDGGETWRPTTDDLPALPVGAIAWAPGTEGVVYLGTGEGDTLLLAGISGFHTPGIGLLRSDDSGESWTAPASGGEPNSMAFFALNIDPEHDELVFAATNEGLLKTEDGGVTWETLVPSVAGSYAFTEVARSKSNPDLMYACQWCEGPCPPGTGRVMRSEDRGLTWLPVSGEGLPGLSGYSNRAAFAVAPSNDHSLYFVTNTTRGISTEPPTSGVFRSDDGGEIWVETGLSASDDAREFLGKQGWYANTVVIHATDPDRVIAGGLWYVLTSDGGQTWVNRNPLDEGDGMGTPTLPHTSAHDLQFQGNVLWVATDGGAWASQDHGETWTSRSDGVVTRQYFGMAIDPINRQRVLGGSQGNGTNLKGEEGDDNYSVLLGGNGFECAINPALPDIMYATQGYTTVFRRDPLSRAFSNISPPFYDEDPPFATPLTLHPSNPNVIMTGTTRLWRSDNGGESWYGLPRDAGQDVSGFPWISTSILAIATTPIDPNRVVISKGGAVYTSNDGGLSWYGSVVTDSAIHLDISPHDSNLVLAAMEASTDGRGVMRSIDGGMTWEASGNGLPLTNTQVVRFDPIDAEVVYAGTERGLFRSVDGGHSWERWGNGIPAVSIHDLRLFQDGSMLRAASHGRGFWEFSFPSPPNTPPEINIASPSASTVWTQVGETLDLEAGASDVDGDAITIDWYRTTDFRTFWEDQGIGEVISAVTLDVLSGGVYQIAARVTDTLGRQAVDYFSVIVGEPADRCETPRLLSSDGPYPLTILTSNQLATTQESDPFLTCLNPGTSHPDSGREFSVWFEFTPKESASYVISTCGSATDTLLSVWTGEQCGPYLEVSEGCADDDEQEHCMGPRTDSYLELNLTAGTTYHMMVGSWKNPDGISDPGTVQFQLDCIDCSNEPPENVVFIDGFESGTSDAWNH